MKIGVVGDSHGRLNELSRAVLAMGKVDLIIHTGDYYDDVLYLKEEVSPEVIGVIGNSDRMYDEPREELLDIDETRIFVTHGHLYGVKMGLGSLLRRAKDVDAHVVLFGHTHVYRTLSIEGILFVNPGSVAIPRNFFRKKTFAVLNPAREQSTARIRAFK